jgi:hypothetical protein
MALGFSGSNGGISENIMAISKEAVYNLKENLQDDNLDKSE